MKTFAQIQNNKAHWVFEAEEKPEFHESIVLVDITDFDPQPQEGWDYDSETGEFTEPVYEEIPVEPEVPEVPELSIEGRLAAIQNKMEEDRIQQLDVLMGIYEEILILNTPAG